VPNCNECGARIQSGTLCQQHALEAQHGTLEDRRDDCTVCETTIDPDEPESDDYDGPAHAECGGQARCDGGLLDPDRLGRCPSCKETVRREDEHYEVTRNGEDHPLTGTSVFYHADCAPFGATSIADQVEKQQASRKRGSEMRAELANGGDSA